MPPRHLAARPFLEAELEPARVYLEPELLQPLVSRQFLEVEAPVFLDRRRLRTNLLFLVHPLSSRHQVIETS